MRSNLPNIVKVNDLVRTVQSDLQRYDAIETRVKNSERTIGDLHEACKQTNEITRRAIEESNLKSYYTYATVTTDDLPLYSFENPAKLESAAPLLNAITGRVGAGKRVLVEFPASNGPLDTKFMRTRFVDALTGESTLHWLPVQGTGRFWLAQNADTSKCRYLADFSVTP